MKASNPIHITSKGMVATRMAARRTALMTSHHCWKVRSLLALGNRSLLAAVVRTGSMGIRGDCSGAALNVCCTPRSRSPELGIDIPSIIRKTRCILTNKLTSEVLKDLDLGGPLILYAMLG